MLPFWLSIGFLSLVQGVLVALPRAPTSRFPCSAAPGPLVGSGAAALDRRRDRRRSPSTRASAHFLTWLALIAVPPLAAIALGWIVHGARPLARPPGRAPLRPRLGGEGRTGRAVGGAGALGARLRHPRLAPGLRGPGALGEARHLRDGDRRRLPRLHRPPPGTQLGPQRRRARRPTCRSCSWSTGARR